jgi:acyl-CoA dehydrogenase
MTASSALTGIPGSAHDAIAAARRAAAVAAEHATDVDRAASFPAQALHAITDAGLLAAVLPVSAGGLGLDVATLASIAGELARGCGSAAMIWSMHQLQLACVARHGGLGTPAVTDVLSTVVSEGLLMASVTSERGIGGDLGRSRAAVAGATLAKEASTVSYGAQAGAFLITARRDPDAAPDDQVAVVVHRDQVRLTPRGAWNPMGMRGTCSPAFDLRVDVRSGQLLPEPFADVAARTLMPLSQILWSSVWIGLATEATARAARLLAARDTTDARLAWSDQILTGLRAQLRDAITCFDEVDTGAREADKAFKLRMNALKLAASTTTLDVAQHALAICGFPGYQEDGPYSVARQLRDLYSARIMVSNDRLVAANAANAVALYATG